MDRKIIEADEKLGKLVDGYLENTIDKEVYIQKKEVIIKQKTELHQKKSDFANKGISWIEPLKEFWKDVYQAKNWHCQTIFMK